MSQVVITERPPGEKADASRGQSGMSRRPRSWWNSRSPSYGRPAALEGTLSYDWKQLSRLATPWTGGRIRCRSRRWLFAKGGHEWDQRILAVGYHFVTNSSFLLARRRDSIAATMKHFVRVAVVLSLTLSATAQKGSEIDSPQIHDDRSVTFTLRAPDSQNVTLRGQWNREQVPMTKGENGLWSITVPDVRAGVWEYSFHVDGLSMIDPLNPAMKPQRNPNTSILHLPGTPPNVWSFQDVPHGTVHQHAYRSKALGKQRSAWVYTPPGYEADSGTKYPLLVLQHGSGDRHETWVVHGKSHWILDNLIAAGRERGHPRMASHARRSLLAGLARLLGRIRAEAVS